MNPFTYLQNLDERRRGLTKYESIAILTNLDERRQELTKSIVINTWAPILTCNCPNYIVIFPHFFSHISFIEWKVPKLVLQIHCSNI